MLRAIAPLWLFHINSSIKNVVPYSPMSPKESGSAADLFSSIWKSFIFMDSVLVLSEDGRKEVKMVQI